MVYYLKKAYNLNLAKEYTFPAEEINKKEWVVRFWSAAYFYKNENGDLIYHHSPLFLFKSKKEAIECLGKTRCLEVVELLVCHSINKVGDHWIDFYEMIEQDDGSYKTKKLKKAYACFKGEQLFNDKKEEIPLNYEKYKSAKTNSIKTRTLYADGYGEVMRFQIIQKDRLDIFHHEYQYFGVNDWLARGVDKKYKRDHYYNLLVELYNEVFLKASDIFDENGGSIILNSYDTGCCIYKFFPREDFQKVKDILSKYIEPEFIPVFLTDNVETKKEDWWRHR